MSSGHVYTPGMANHCIDVVCTGCGRCWCLRGCGYNTKPDPKAAEKARRVVAVKGSFKYNERCCPDPAVVVCDSVLHTKESELVVPEVMDA